MSARVGLSVTGQDGFTLEGASSMAEISRSPDCPPWTYGARALMRDLAGAGLV